MSKLSEIEAFSAIIRVRNVNPSRRPCPATKTKYKQARSSSWCEHAAHGGSASYARVFTGTFIKLEFDSKMAVS